jgi:hypothetical protein
MRWVVLVCALAACGRVGFDPFAAHSTDGGAGEGGGGTSDAPDSGGAQAIKLVQIAGPSVVGGVAGTSVMFSAAPLTGNVIVVWVWTFKSGASSLGPASVSDNLTNAYVLGAVDNQNAGQCDGSTGTAAAAVYAAYVTMTGVLTVSAIPTGGAPQEIGLLAIEYEGLAGVVDNDAHTESPGTASPMSISSNTLTTTPGDRLIVAVGNACSGAPNVGTWTDNSGFTVRAATGITNGAPPGIATDLITNQAGMHTDRWTWTYTGAGPFPGIGAIAAFR